MGLVIALVMVAQQATQSAKLLTVSVSEKSFPKKINNSDDRANAEKFGNMMSHLLKVMSSDQPVDLLKYKSSLYKDYCTDLYVLLLSKLSFVSIIPTLHKLLAHSAYIIE